MLPAEPFFAPRDCGDSTNQSAFQVMNTVKLAREAMATRFEIVLHGENPISLQAAGEEALEEIDWVESQLSIYRSDSQINRANHFAAAGPVQMEPTVFELLQRCKTLSQWTQGAFDITLGPLIRCWGFMGKTGLIPTNESIRRARKLVGMHLVHLDCKRFTIQFDKEGVMLDLGSVGKGYALERAKEILEANGVRSALLHGGTSTVATIGSPPNQDAWKIAIASPRKEKTEAENKELTDAPPLGLANLKGESLSVSAVWGKSFRIAEKEYGHVIDGRAGFPSTGTALAAVQTSDAADADAISTALLVDGKVGKSWLKKYFPNSRSFLLNQGNRQDFLIENDGFERL